MLYKRRGHFKKKKKRMSILRALSWAQNQVSTEPLLISVSSPLSPLSPSMPFSTSSLCPPSSYVLPSWPSGSCQENAHSAVRAVEVGKALSSDQKNQIQALVLQNPENKSLHFSNNTRFPGCRGQMKQYM